MAGSDDAQHVALAGVCKALADPTRLAIVIALRLGERSVGALCDDVDVSQSNASQHLAVLRERGVVTGRRDGTTVHYRLTGPEVLGALDLLAGLLDRPAQQQPADPPPAATRMSTVFLG